jgi:Fe-S-cluster containining protein
MRLKRGLGLSSGGFLERFTLRHTGPGTGLPVVTLKPADPKELICPFVTPAGCRVYPDRPSSCRTYPLVRIARRNRATGRITRDYMLLRELHCRGFEAGALQTVKKWVADSDISDYDCWSDRMLEIISLKNLKMPGPLSDKLVEPIFTALYDLDRFRQQMLNEGLPAGFALPPAAREQDRHDDTALLNLGLEWVKKALAG